MAGSAGKLQSAFTAGEVDPLIHERTELRFYSGGLARAENIEIAPQGGFRLRDGLRDIGEVDGECSRLFAFNASNGESFDLAFRPGWFEIWGQGGQAGVANMTLLGAEMLAGFTIAQWLDTMLVFHEDLETQRIVAYAADNWAVDPAPFENVPSYDFGADSAGNPYGNGVAAVWQLEFTALDDEATTFELTVAGDVTTAVLYSSTPATLSGRIKAAIEALPNVPGEVSVTNPSGDKYDVAFDGEGLGGDGWSLSGRSVNKADAVITAAKLVVGVAPGEPVMSWDRGWPQCGAFFQQKLLIGGFRALPNSWAWSQTAGYFNFDTRLEGPTGAALVPMDSPGGEKIEHMLDNRFLVIFTNQAEYWISGRALSTGEPPNHVQASTKGARRGTRIITNEGFPLYVRPGGNVLCEFRYTDVEGNYVSQDISLAASHLIRDVVDLAQRPARLSTDGNHVVAAKGDGAALLGTLLRDQDPPITAFTRLSSGAGAFKACARNGRGEMSFIVQRPDSRRLERFEEGLLLDEALDGVNAPAAATIAGIGRFDGRECWVIADGDVFGPFVPTAGTLTLPRAVSTWTVGSWAPPVVETLPPDRNVGPQIVNKRKARIFAVTLSLIDTTSVAISTNGRRLQDVDLRRYGDQADVPELEAAFTGEVKIPGLVGWADEPFVTISQVRPGRLTVRSITVHAKL